MIKKFAQSIWNRFLYAIFYPLVIVFTMLMWYSEYVDGVEPKTGQPYRKHKTINGQQFVKQRGVKNVFKPWKPVPKVNTFGELSINSMYPHVVIVKDLS